MKNSIYAETNQLFVYTQTHTYTLNDFNTVESKRPIVYSVYAAVSCRRCADIYMLQIQRIGQNEERLVGILASPKWKSWDYSSTHTEARTPRPRIFTYVAAASSQCGKRKCDKIIISFYFSSSFLGSTQSPKGISLIFPFPRPPFPRTRRFPACRISRSLIPVLQLYVYDAEDYSSFLFKSP